MFIHSIVLTFIPIPFTTVTALYLQGPYSSEYKNYSRIHLYFISAHLNILDGHNLSSTRLLKT